LEQAWWVVWERTSLYSAGMRAIPGLPAAKRIVVTCRQRLQSRCPLRSSIFGLFGMKKRQRAFEKLKAFLNA
jgi:hypothetical protein